MRTLHCRGAVALEAAVMMVLLVPLLVASLYFGRLALAGAALENAVSNAARYMATVPDENLHDPVRSAAALAAARRIFDDTLAAANVPARELTVSFMCDTDACSSLSANSTPARVGVNAGFKFPNTDLFPYYTYGNNETTWLEERAEVGREK